MKLTHSWVRHSVEKCHWIDYQDVIEWGPIRGDKTCNWSALSVSCSSMNFPTQRFRWTSFLTLVHLIMKHRWRFHKSLFSAGEQKVKWDFSCKTDKWQLFQGHNLLFFQPYSYSFQLNYWNATHACPGPMDWRAEYCSGSHDGGRQEAGMTGLGSEQ